MGASAYPFGRPTLQPSVRAKIISKSRKVPSASAAMANGIETIARLPGAA